MMPAARTAWWQARAEHWARLGNHKLQAFCSKQAAYMPREPDKRIRPYLEHLDREGPGVPPVWCTSHETLRMIQAQYGVRVVDSLLREHWGALRGTARCT